VLAAELAEALREPVVPVEEAQVEPPV
jgi:hypothetical protein